MNGSRWSIAMLALAFGSMSCASAQPPGEAISRAEVSIRKADEVGASQHAALELLKAREKLDKARSAALDDDEWNEARRMAEQAAVDARLAEEKARAERARVNAREMRLSIDSLRAEIARQRGEE